MWILATARSSSTRTYSSGPPMLKGVRPSTTVGTPCRRYQRESEPPTRMFTAGAVPSTFGRDARRCARRSRGRVGVKLGSKRRMARQVTPSSGPAIVELGHQHVGGDADGQADVGAGDGVRRHEIGRGAALDGADVDGHALQASRPRRRPRAVRRSASPRRSPAVTTGGAWKGRRLEILQPVERGAQPVDGVGAAMDVRAVRRRAASPRPRPTSGPSRRSARPSASRRRRRYWRRPWRAARAPASSRCRASPCSPRRRRA